MDGTLINADVVGALVGFVTGAAILDMLAGVWSGNMGDNLVGVESTKNSIGS